MKTCLSVCASLLLLLEYSSAIPQRVSGFLGAAGMPFEQFAMAGETWAPGADLKGKWNARVEKAPAKDGIETLDLAIDADVFGIPAAKVSAERAGGVVRRFIVRYDEAKLTGGVRAKGGNLFARVTANLQAMAGVPTSKSPGGELTFHHDAATIVARHEGAREVVVEFTPAR